MTPGVGEIFNHCLFVCMWLFFYYLYNIYENDVLISK